MIRLELTRGSSGILTQSFSEVCEHCDEKVTPIDLADIITKKPNDPRTLKIRDKNNNLYTLKTKGARIEEIKVEARKKQLLDDSGEELKYGIRAERMCSESIDTINGVTASFCYRTTSEKFLAKKSGSVSFASKFNASDEIEHTEEGQKLGMDRKGNVIRLAAYKRIDMETGTAIDTDAQQKYEGPYKTKEQAEAITRRIHDDGQGVVGSYVHEVAEQKGIETTLLARQENMPLQIKVKKQ